MANTWENETEYQTDIYRQIDLDTATLITPHHMFLSYHSNSWRRQQVSGGHHSEVSDVDHHIADRHQGDPNDDGQRQIPGWQETCYCPVTCVPDHWEALKASASWLATVAMQSLVSPEWVFQLFCDEIQLIPTDAKESTNGILTLQTSRYNKITIIEWRNFLCAALQLHSSVLTAVKPPKICSVCRAKLWNCISVPFNIIRHSAKWTLTTRRKPKAHYRTQVQLLQKMLTILQMHSTGSQFFLEMYK